ncbi:hypothetical protein G9A89_023348 [Geosiphon pyriformis]|nr:hypothetical protein G9A89_023348 [Geosiphon pyriformis]
MSSHLSQSRQHYTPICTETVFPILEKNEQSLRNMKLIPKASAISNSLITPAKNITGKPEIDMGTDLSREIKPHLSINARCLAWTNQMLSQNTRQNSHTKPTILLVSFLEFLKTKTDFRNQSLKTKPLHRATPISTSEIQEANTCEIHKEKQNLI